LFISSIWAIFQGISIHKKYCLCICNVVHISLFNCAGFYSGYFDCPCILEVFEGGSLLQWKLRLILCNYQNPWIRGFLAYLPLFLCFPRRIPPTIVGKAAIGSIWSIFRVLTGIRQIRLILGFLADLCLFTGDFLEKVLFPLDTMLFQLKWIWPGNPREIVGFPSWKRAENHTNHQILPYLSIFMSFFMDRTDGEIWVIIQAFRVFGASFRVLSTGCWNW